MLSWMAGRLGAQRLRKIYTYLYIVNKKTERAVFGPFDSLIEPVLKPLDPLVEAMFTPFYGLLEVSLGLGEIGLGDPVGDMRPAQRLNWARRLR